MSISTISVALMLVPQPELDLNRAMVGQGIDIEPENTQHVQHGSGPCETVVRAAGIVVFQTPRRSITVTRPSRRNAPSVGFDM